MSEKHRKSSWGGSKDGTGTAARPRPRAPGTGRGTPGPSASSDYGKKPQQNSNSRSRPTNGRRQSDRQTYAGQAEALTNPEDYPMQEDTGVEERKHRDDRAINHDVHVGSSVDHQKQEKGYLRRAGEYVAAKFGNFGGNAKVTFNQSDITIIAEKKARAKQEDLRCSQIIITQPKEVPGDYVNGVNLRWCVPKPEHCKIVSLLVMVVSDSATVVEKKIAAKRTTFTIDGDKLLCGNIYYAAVKTILEHCDGEQGEAVSDWKKFITRPGRPKDIRVECDEGNATVHWSPFRGAEKFAVSIFDTAGLNLDCGETSGTQFSCKFCVDNAKGIRLGQEYVIEVVAIRAELENHSGLQKHFFGKSDSPKSVVAKMVEGTNKVNLSWKSPGFSITGYSYVVEIVPGSGPVRRLEATKSTTQEISDLKQGMSYTFRVSTVGGSLWSTSNTIKTDTCTIKVEKFRVDQSAKNPAQYLECAWDAVQDAKGYKIRCKCPDRVVIMTARRSETSYTITGLAPNTTYKVAIKAEDEKGYGPYTVDEERSTSLGTPSDVSLRVLNRNEIEVTFVEASGASSHKISLADNEGKEKVAKVDAGKARCLFAGLSFNTEYSAVVTALYGQVEQPSIRSENALTAPEQSDVDDIAVVPEENHLDSAFTISLKISEAILKCQTWIKCKDQEGDEDNVAATESIIQMTMDRKKKRAFLLYKGLYKGVVYGVRVRTKNNGGFSEWSSEKLVKTAPRKIDSLTISHHEGKVVAKWENVKRVRAYTIVLFEAGENICTKHNVLSPYTFLEEIEHGLKYFCQIYPENVTGRGRTTASNTILIPLDPPKNLEMHDEIVQASFRWESSTGMRSAKITFSNSEFDETNFLTRKNSWTSPYVTDGEVYTFTIWARNGEALSREFLTEKYVTAPSKVILKRNVLRPETCLDVEIVTKHNGPFLLTWYDSTKTRKTQVSTLERCFTIENLKPATEYTAHASCIYGYNLERISQKCHSDEVMTRPEKVTGVRCISFLGEEYKELSWEGCGNSCVEYAITWSRNNTFFSPITTTKTSWKFKHLEEGKYSFRVSAGGGKKSDDCFIIVPNVPKMQLDLLSCKELRVLFSPKTLAEERYYIKLTRGLDHECFATETKECEYIIDEEKFLFEKGVKYTLVSKAYWKDQCGLATRREFITGLETPTDFACELDHHDPQRPVKFTWKKSKAMYSARIKLREMYNRLSVEECTSNSRWEYCGLEPNRTYEFLLWPGDGRRFFHDDCIRHKFTTAPDAPTTVWCKPDKADPERSFQIEIESDYKGLFLTEVVNMDQEIVAEHRGYEKSFIISNLTANTMYLISSVCLFGDNATGKKYASRRDEENVG